MSGSRRNQIVTDQPVQGELLYRALVYWVFCMVVLEVSVIGWLHFNDPSATYLQLAQDSLKMNAPAFLCSIFLLPLVLYDLLRVSSRFAGPVQSVRLTLRQLAEGQPARRVYLRRDDFWQDLAHYANVVADRVESNAQTAPSQEDQSDRSKTRTDDGVTTIQLHSVEQELIEV